jgi:hypothetical protein
MHCPPRTITPTHHHPTRSGKLEAGTYALNANKGKKERIGRLMLMHANNRCGCALWRRVFVCACVRACVRSDAYT